MFKIKRPTQQTALTFDNVADFFSKCPCKSLKNNNLFLSFLFQVNLFLYFILYFFPCVLILYSTVHLSSFPSSLREMDFICRIRLFRTRFDLGGKNTVYDQKHFDSLNENDTGKIESKYLQKFLSDFFKINTRTMRKQVVTFTTD